MIDAKEIVQALRCCAKGLGHDDACENCKVEKSKIGGNTSSLRLLT